MAGVNMAPWPLLLLLLLLSSASVVSVDDGANCETGDDGDGACSRGGSEGVVAGVAGAIGSERSQRDYYRAASHYDALWGQDNLHIGYFPHLDKRTGVELSPSQSGVALTERMIDLAGIGPSDRVLDLGSGKGLACKTIAELTGASCTGIDLTPANVERGNALAEGSPHLKLSYHEGSFTDLPSAVLEEGPYDVVFSQVAFCHVHSSLGEIFRQVLRALKADTGRFVVNDYLGGDGIEPSADTVEHVYKRLHFKELHGHRSWRSVADGATHGGEDGDGDGGVGHRLELLRYENLDGHVREFYARLVDDADRHGFVSKDGTSLATNYDQTVAAAERNEIGMNLALYAKRRL